MAEVENKIFIHIHTLSDTSDCPNKYSPKWIQGNKLSFGQENFNNPNILHDSIYNPNIDIDKEKKFIKKLSQKIITSKSVQEFADIENLFLEKSLLYTYFQLTREVVLENVRQALFPKKPSRLNSIWLTDFDYKERWIEIFSNFNLPYKIFLIKFTGRVHKADARWITNDCSPLSFNSYHKNAVGYWKGTHQSKKGKPDEEYIGNGYLEIIEEIISD